MAPVKDLTNQRFGRLIANYYVGKSLWHCHCDCGNETIAKSYRLQIGKTQSCGCISRERPHNLQHGHSKTTPEFKIWAGMRTRCYDKNNRAYPRYGGRGIDICVRWRNDFTEFYKDMGPRPDPYMQLERIDNDLGYSPENCRWATVGEQANNRSTNRLIRYRGKTQTATQWAKELGLNAAVILKRMREDGLTGYHALYGKTKHVNRSTPRRNQHI